MKKNVLMIASPVLPDANWTFYPLSGLLNDEDMDVHLLKDPIIFKNGDLFPQYERAAIEAIEKLGKTSLVGTSASGEVCIRAASARPENIEKVILLDCHLNGDGNTKAYDYAIQFLRTIDHINEMIFDYSIDLDNILVSWALTEMSKGPAGFREETAKKELKDSYYNSVMDKKREELKKLGRIMGAHDLANRFEDWINEIRTFDYNRLTSIQDKVHAFCSASNPNLIKKYINQVEVVPDCYHIVSLDRPVTAKNLILKSIY